MEFRVLGPLVVSRAGVRLDVRGPVCRRLLALLLVEPGRSASMAWLVDGIWDTNPPQTASRQVRNAVGRLRKVLGSERIVSEGDGYRLDTTGVTIDSLRFEAAVRESRLQAAAGDTRQAAENLRTGLKLWRGSAFADVSGQAVEAKATRLAEARLSAVEDCIGWELDSGRVAHLVDELRLLLADHPYRQSLTGLLMTALHRSGRTPEALVVYERTSQRLAEDLGLDPDRALRQRYAAIVDGDHGQAGSQPLDAESEAPRILTARMTAPAQLPMLPATFVGRSEQHSRLHGFLADREHAPTCVISGAPGTGKTALAVNWAHQVRKLFPGGQLFINLRGIDKAVPVTALEALGRFIRALQGPDAVVPADVDEASARYRSLLAGRRVLVVLDNAGDAEQVRPLLPADDTCFTVVTSRNRLAGLEPATPIALPPLPRNEAVDLLGAVLGTQRTHADPALTDRLAHLCGDLPLALRIGAARLTNDPGRSVGDFVRDLRVAERLDVLSVDGERIITAAMDQSYLALPPGGRALLCELALIPGDDFPEALALELGTDSDFRQLTTASLIDQHRTNRYRFHDLTREYAAGKAEGTVDAKSVAANAIGWYHDNCRELNDHDYNNVLAMISHWRAHPEFWRLVHTVVAFIRKGLNISVVAPFVDDELSIALERGDTEAAQAMFDAKAQLCSEAGDIPGDVRYSKRALEIHPDSTGFYHFTHGDACFSNGEMSLAEANFATALRIASSAEDQYTVLAATSALSNLYRVSGRYAEAEQLLDSVRTYCDRNPTGALEVDARMAFVTFFCETGRVTEAEQMLQPLLTCQRQLDAGSQTQLLMFRADIHHARGEYREAIQLFDLALKLTEGNSRIQANLIRTSLADIYCDLEEFDEALEQLNIIDLDSASEKLRAIGTLQLARVHIGRADHARAAAAATFAAEVFSTTRIRSHALALTILADAHAGLGDHDAARTTREQSLRVLTEMGLPEAEDVRRLLATDG